MSPAEHDGVVPGSESIRGVTAASASTSITITTTKERPEVAVPPPSCGVGPPSEWADQRTRRQEVDEQVLHHSLFISEVLDLQEHHLPVPSGEGVGGKQL